MLKLVKLDKYFKNFRNFLTGSNKKVQLRLHNTAGKDGVRRVFFPSLSNSPEVFCDLVDPAGHLLKDELDGLEGHQHLDPLLIPVHGIAECTETVDEPKANIGSFYICFNQHTCIFNKITLFSGAPVSSPFWVSSGLLKLFRFRRRLSA